MSRTPGALLAAEACLAAACGGEVGGVEGGVDGVDAPAPDEAPQAAGALWFTDATAESGLAAFRQVNGSPDKPFLLEAVGAGVALFDADGDGLLDVFLSNGGRLEQESAPPPRDALFKNRGELRFAEATEGSGLGTDGWTMGAYAAELDGDGRTDLYLTAFGPDTLYLRSPDGAFVDATARAGVADALWSTGAAFLDFERDGDLDLYVANYVVFDPAHPPRERFVYRGIEVHFGPRGMPGARDAFYLNAGDGTFTDATLAMGVGSDAYGFGVVAFDHDEDAFVDVFVANDSLPNHLWRNESGRRFRDVAFEAGVAVNKSGTEQAGMGAAVGDVDGDGRLDLYVTTFSGDYNTLFRADGGGFFRDATVAFGLATPTLEDLGWGVLVLDLDQDGRSEIVVANGHIYPQVDLLELGTRYHQRNQVFAACGQRRFADVTDAAGPGFAGRASARGLAAGDLDADGDLDLLFGNLDGPPTLLRNESRTGACARIRLVGRGRNQGAVGALVRVTAGGRTQVFQVGCGSGFLSTSDRTVHAGLGAAVRLDSVVVRWPDGAEERWEDLAAGGLLTLEQGAAPGR